MGSIVLGSYTPLPQFGTLATRMHVGKTAVKEKGRPDLQAPTQPLDSAPWPKYPLPHLCSLRGSMTLPELWLFAIVTINIGLSIESFLRYMALSNGASGYRNPIQKRDLSRYDPSQISEDHQAMILQPGASSAPLRN